MAQMFIDPVVVRAFRTADDLESFDINDDVYWLVWNEEHARAVLPQRYATYEEACRARCQTMAPTGA